MWKYSRSLEPPPEDLRSKRAAEYRRNLFHFFTADAGRRSQSSPPVKVEHIYEASVDAALNRLFRSKCAFCEQKTSLRTYQFRPPQEAIPTQTDDPHLYYSWLSDAWENLYPICAECSPRNPNYFPVTGKRMPLPTKKQLQRFAETSTGLFWRADRPEEKQLFLDPCENSDLTCHFVVVLEGELMGKTQRASETIEHFALNRSSLASARREVFSDRITTLRDGIGNYWEDRHGEPITGLFDFAEQEFGGTWFLLLRDIMREIASGTKLKWRLGPARLEQALQSFSEEESAVYRFDLAMRRLAARKIDEEGRPSPRRVGQKQISRVEIEDFKGIAHLSLEMPAPIEAAPGSDPATPSLLILGENSSGKTSLLEAIALALADGRSLDHLPIELDDYIFDPSFVGSNDARPESSVIRITDEDGEKRQIHISDAGYRFGTDRDFEMAPVFAFGAFRHYGDKSRQHSASRYIRNLFVSSEPLSNPERWLLGLKEEPFNEVIRRLRSILSIEGDFDVIEADREREICFVVNRVPGPHGDAHTKVPIRAVSSGYRAILAMACEIMQGLMERRVNPAFESLATARGVVLIDEIEAHLHPRWKLAVMRGLRAALPGLTFIVTSHDPLCLRGMHPSEVVVMRRVASQDDTDVKTSYVEILSDLPDMSQFRIDQLLTSDFFQLYSTDDPATEERLAEAAEILGRTEDLSALTAREKALISQLEEDVASSLPVGDREVQRLVQGAVAEFLVEKRQVSADRQKQLSDETRQEIRAVLGRI